MKIAEVLERHGSSLKEVARAIGMKPSTLQTTIDGNPTVGTLRKIAEAARCPLAEFFEDELLEAGLRIVAAPSSQPSAGSESSSASHHLPALPAGDSHQREVVFLGRLRLEI